MRLRALAITAALAVSSLVFAASAFASDNGQGLYGETDDKVVSFFGLGLVLFFTLVVIIGSTIQGILDRRKEEKKAAQKRQLAGW
jgi:nitrogen fixation/metabolism regulation signal transduction histidine kinase